MGMEGELRGCINDTKNVSAFLMERYNYKREDMVRCFLSLQTT